MESDSKKFLSKKNCKSKNETVLRRTTRLTTFFKSYSENIVNFNYEKEFPARNKRNRLSFCVLNVGGLRSKMKSEDFFDFLNDYDIRTQSNLIVTFHEIDLALNIPIFRKN